MSYSRSFTRRVAVHYSGTVRYPASETAGTVSYSGTAYEDVTVNINVETAHFDKSVGECNGNVGLLTGAVVATEAAQVSSIKENAKKVGNTIINGFFKTVGYEISQQISELSNRINATLLHLAELSNRCKEKKKQMDNDYHRLSDRYVKVFDELNAELKNRIYELDRPVFGFRQNIDKNSYKALGTDIVGTVAVSGSENSRLEALISASMVKKQAQETMGKADSFLVRQWQTERLLHECLVPEDFAGKYYIPVCYFEYCDMNNCSQKDLFESGVVSCDRDFLFEEFEKKQWIDSDIETADQIKNYFLHEVSENCKGADSHTGRIADYINKLFNDSKIKII